MPIKSLKRLDRNTDYKRKALSLSLIIVLIVGTVSFALSSSLSVTTITSTNLSFLAAIKEAAGQEDEEGEINIPEETDIGTDTEGQIDSDTDTGETDGGITQVPIPQTIEICDDGLDNDNNGLVDLDDPACLTIVEPNQPDPQNNNPPEVYDQSVVTGVNTPVDIAFEATYVNPTDPDNDYLTASIVQFPLSGSLSEINQQDTGTVSYTPNPGFTGQDSFTYKVNDGTVDSNTATVSITVDDNGGGGSQTNNNNNNPPVVYDQPILTTMNTPVGIALWATDANPTDKLTATIVTPSASGQLSEIDQTTGTVSYTPSPGFSGQDSFTFKVNDGLADSNIATVSITVDGNGGGGGGGQTNNNSPPEVYDQNVQTTIDIPIDITLLANDADSNLLRGTIVSQPVHGSLSEINQETGTVTYTPNPGISGQDSFTYKVNDGLADSINTATVSVTVSQNSPPVAFDQHVQTDMDIPIDITLQASDTTPSDELTGTIVSQPINGTLSEINQNIGVVTYTPNPGISGQDSFTYKVNDGLADSNTATISITVNGGGSGPGLDPNSVKHSFTIPDIPIRVDMEITPGVQYTPTSEDLATAKEIGFQVYNIGFESANSQGGLNYQLTYFVPYSALPADILNSIEGSEMTNPTPVSTKEEKLQPSNALFLPIQASTVNGIKVGIDVLYDTYKNINNVKKVLDLLNRLQIWAEWGKKFDEVQRCVDNPKVPYFSDDDKKRTQGLLDDVKASVAGTVFIDHLFKAMSTFIGGGAPYWAKLVLLVPLDKYQSSEMKSINDRDMARLKHILSNCLPKSTELFASITFEGSGKHEYLGGSSLKSMSGTIYPVGPITPYGTTTRVSAGGTPSEHSWQKVEGTGSATYSYTEDDYDRKGGKCVYKYEGSFKLSGRVDIWPGAGSSSHPQGYVEWYIEPQPSGFETKLVSGRADKCGGGSGDMLMHPCSIVSPRIDVATGKATSEYPGGGGSSICTYTLHGVGNVPPVPAPSPPPPPVA